MELTNKYKLHKSNYIQFGGTKNVFDTNRQQDYDVNFQHTRDPLKKTINQLTNMPIKCKNMTGLNKFELIREYHGEDDVNNKLFYNYHCVNNHKNVYSFFNETNRIPFNNGETYNLKHINIDCNDKPINTFELNKDLNGDLYYKYKCSNIPIDEQSKIVKHTNFNDDGNGQNIYLDRHNITCDDEQVITQFNMEHNDQHQYRYKYTCGNPKVPSKIIDIPFRIPDTQSWLYMPLIMLGFNDIIVTFPTNFILIFDTSINEYNIQQIKIGGLPFNNFDTFVNYIRDRINSFNVRTLDELIQRKLPEIIVDGEYHIRGDHQENIIYNNSPAIETFMRELIVNVINKLSGQQIFIYNR